MAEFRLPNNSHRVAIAGRTGSGKTRFATWLLSTQNFDKQPWVIVDYKGDELLNSLDEPYIKEIGLAEVPKKPGLYIVHPRHTDEEEVQQWLWSVWKKEHVGIYLDEAYMVPGGQRSQKGALQAILTQGRSKRIPVIALTQRPVFVNRFITSEADFHCVFHMNFDSDKKVVESYLPKGSLDAELPEYHSRWFDVGKNALHLMKPVPDDEGILERIESRMRPRRSYY